MIYFFLGLFFSLFFLEPFVINFIYFSNISLFRDIILSKKNRERLDDFYETKY